jgi:hypothetical protein
MKVIVLLTADTSEIKERDTVRESQEKVEYIRFKGPCHEIFSLCGPGAQMELFD